MSVPLGRYRHWKGAIYEVLMTAKHSEQLTPMVVYRLEGGVDVWVRPESMFLDTVPREGKQRFQWIGPVKQENK